MNQRLQLGRLDIGNTLSTVFSIYADQAAVLLTSALILYLGVFVVSFLLFLAGGAIAVILAALVSLVANTFYTAMVVELVGDLQDGRRDSTPGQLLRAAMPFILPLIGLGIVFWICVGVGLFLLIIPGLLLLTIWWVCVPALILERRGVFASLGRSYELVRGNGLPVFGVAAVVILIYVIAAVIAGAITNSADTAIVTAIVGLVRDVLLAPIIALAISVTYFQLLATQGGVAPAGAVPPAPQQPGVAPPTQPQPPPPGPESPGGQPPPAG